jgi:predicted nucleic acid-binding protein
VAHKGVALVDTTVLIDALRGSEPAQAWLRSIDHRLAASEVSRVEVLQGLRSNEFAHAEALFRAFAWIPIDESIARRAGALGREWRRRQALSVPDLLIAATALDLGANLATGNVQDFPMFADLRAPY